MIAIIFQPEIRKALEQVGRNKKWKRLITIFRQGRGDEWEQKVKKSIIDAADTATLFSHSRTGALIVFYGVLNIIDLLQGRIEAEQSDEVAEAAEENVN